MFFYNIQTWRDWKANVLKKCAQNKSYASGTSGGPPKTIVLTQLEEQLIEIVSPEATGLDNIPQGGAFNRMKKSFNTIPQGVPMNVQTADQRNIAHTPLAPLTSMKKV